MIELSDTKGKGLARLCKLGFLIRQVDKKRRTPISTFLVYPLGQILIQTYFEQYLHLQSLCVKKFMQRQWLYLGQLPLVTRHKSGLICAKASKTIIAVKRVLTNKKKSLLGISFWDHKLLMILTCFFFVCLDR